MSADDTTRTVLSHLDCETTVRRLWDYLDGRLTSLAREEVEAHLAVCALCAPHFVFAREMQSALAASTTVAVPREDDAESRLRARVRDALRRHVTDPDSGSENTN